MAGPRFFEPVRDLSLAEIVTLTGAEPATGASLTRRIRGVAPLDHAGPGDLTFLDNAKYADQLARTRAGACLMDARFAKQAPKGLIVLRTPEPYRAFVAVARQLFPDALRPASQFDSKGIAPGAFVHASARLENGVIVDPGAVIGPDVEIGAGTVIGSNAVVGRGVRIGRDCALGAGASVIHTLIGDRVIIHPGCRIGQDGFGFVMGAAGHAKVPQIGRVIIQDDVEIGAGTAIDRGGIRDTVVGEGTKIDNFVQVGHNTAIGRHCIIVAHTGISGSVTLEDFVVLGARTGIIDHVTVGEGAQLAAASVVLTHVPRGAKWGGWPARPVKEYLREMATTRRSRRGKAQDVHDAGDERE
jgi:UDP-3-O-[3-hydroxymyristoyl] glucosamine N-acyltransferase